MKLLRNKSGRGLVGYILSLVISLIIILALLKILNIDIGLADLFVTGINELKALVAGIKDLL